MKRITLVIVIICCNYDGFVLASRKKELNQNPYTSNELFQFAARRNDGLSARALRNVLNLGDTKKLLESSNDKKVTLLMHAADHSYDAVEVLCEFNPAFERKDNDGNTAAHHAVLACYPESLWSLQCLVKKNAPLSIKNNKNQDVFEAAEVLYKEFQEKVAMHKDSHTTACTIYDCPILKLRFSAIECKKIYLDQLKKEMVQQNASPPSARTRPSEFDKKQ